MKILFTLLILLFTTAKVIACSCAPTEKVTKSEIESATDIFKGKVLSIEKMENSGLLKITLEVKENIKGALAEQKVIYTKNNSASCGLSFNNGELWYIFGTKKKGLILVNMCQRHKNITKPKCKLFPKNRSVYKTSKEIYKKKSAALDVEISFIKTMLKEV